MNGFEAQRNQVIPAAAPPSVTRSYSDIPWSEVQRLVARAHAERSAYVTSGLRRWLSSWASVFRGPGHILPRESGRRHVSAH